MTQNDDDRPADLAATALRRLLDVMAALRHPATGCPWDLQQDFHSIAPYTIEEAYEVADAIAETDHPALAEELGDLLFQVVYHARLGEEASLFDFAEITRIITDKMIRRHPHVFINQSVQDDFWERGKAKERAARAQHGALAGVAQTLPALTRAAKLSNRAARTGFDWPDIASILDKMAEEIDELRAELAEAVPARLQDEIGDILFTTVNLARRLGIDPEASLRHANSKFERRFGAIEDAAASQGRSVTELSMSEMEAAWMQAKRDGL